MRLYFLFLLLIALSYSLRGQDKLAQQLQKGIDFFEKGKHAKAERIFDKILEQEESYAIVYLWKGKCLQVFEEYEAAYEALSIARDLDPDQASFWMAIGDLKYTLAFKTIQKPELCGSCGKYIINENTNNVSPRSYLLSAIKDYHQVINIDTKHAEAYYKTSISYFNLKKKEAACFNMAIAESLHHPLSKEFLESNCNN